MKAYSKDLPQKIVDALKRGMPKAQAAPTFGIGFSTLKRFAAKAQRGESLQPGTRHPANTPRWMNKSRRSSKRTSQGTPVCHPPRALRLCREAISGVSVSRFHMWSAIARIGSTRKKGDAKRHRARRVSEGRLAGYGGRREVDPERLWCS